MVVRTVLSEHIVISLVIKDSLAQTVLVYVHLTASLASVNTRTDRVLHVLKDGWVVIVQQNVLQNMERIVSIHATNTVLTRLVTGSMVVVCLVAKKVKIVVRIYPTIFLIISKIVLYLLLRNLNFQ